MATIFDAVAVLDSLVVTRKVFHSEADFQFAFAWNAKILYPHLEIRLESHPTSNESLDLLLIDPSTSFGIAIEFKYKTQLWKGTFDGEEYALKDHGASDIGFYDIVKDVTRVERFIENQQEWIGYVITLTNVPRYWNPPNRGGLPMQQHSESLMASSSMELDNGDRTLAVQIKVENWHFSYVAVTNLAGEITRRSVKMPQENLGHW